ncbi:hypothetical protein H8784_08100 [Parabacteroides acidifaciens]|uniref:Uncharacterized protein n=1 Tax=Parabacteroides acidifaciens TaxID=2290935 RepID=A0A3D8HFF8_9BACT|nr:hypothetical protein [Parabacteroides acidifaciens]MBC8601683.1 hypothetical protein [Parabacteroides acidifaciens]RDU49668.1 hypothetical protein DWU89_08285 [Parabacteroides acidifaciens]
MRNYSVDASDAQWMIEYVIKDCNHYLNYEDWPNVCRIDSYYKNLLLTPLKDFLNSRRNSFTVDGDTLFIKGDNGTSIGFSPIQTIMDRRGPYTAIVSSGSQDLIIHLESDDENCYFRRKGSHNFTITPFGLRK